MEVLCKRGVLSTLQDLSENTNIGVFLFSKVERQRTVTLLKRDSGTVVFV